MTDTPDLDLRDARPGSDAATEVAGEEPARLSDVSTGPLESMRLTIDLTREADTPNQWTSTCVELDIISAGKTPERALEAVAEAVRMVTEWCCEHAGDESTRDAMLRIIEEVAERRDRVAEGLDRLEQINKGTTP